MTGRSFPRSCLLTAGFVLALPALAVLFTGCFAPRRLSSLPRQSCPSAPTAVLPVLPSDVRVSVRAMDQADPYHHSATGASFSSLQGLADTANKVLDTLSGGRVGTLKGPSRLAESLESPTVLDNLAVCLADPGPADEPWKREVFAAAAAAVGYDRVLLVRPSVDLQPDSSYSQAGGAGTNTSWKGTVTVTIEDLDLLSGRVVAFASGEAEFSGCAGIIGIGGGPAPYAIAIPYGWGDTLGHALDEAARKAFAALYAPRPQDGGRK